MIDLRSYGGSVAAVARRAAMSGQGLPGLAALVVGFPTWQGIVRSARAFDHLIARDLSDQPVRQPVFIVGHARSGTTFLHRLLALDPRFSAPLAWQLVVPAVSLYRLGNAVGGHPVVRRMAEALAQRLLSPMAPRHETGWGTAEEDDWLFLHMAATPTLGLLTGDPALHRRYWIGDALPPSVSARAMGWYRASVQRHLYATDPDATLLSKNPHFTGWMRTLHHTFPDARFVMMMRQPAHAIASRLEMQTRAWGLPTARHDPRVRSEFEASVDLYRHAERVWPELPRDRSLRVAYDRLVADPVGVLQRIYQHFGWEPQPGVEAHWEAASAHARRRLPREAPKLRHFGIAPSELRTSLAGLDALWQSTGRPS